jgi:hypothetical protein
VFGSSTSKIGPKGTEETEKERRGEKDVVMGKLRLVSFSQRK